MSLKFPESLLKLDGNIVITLFKGYNYNANFFLFQVKKSTSTCRTLKYPI